MSDDDWRARVEVSGDGHLEHLLEHLRADEVAGEARRQTPDGAVISNDGAALFVYAATRAATQAATGVVQRVAERHELTVDAVVLERWHPEEERWEAPSEPLPSTATEHERERERLDDEERAESREQPVPEWEVDLKLPTRSDAVEFSERLTAEGIPNRRSWAYVRVAAETEADARSLAARLGDEAPAGTEVSGPVGSQAEAWAVLHPYAFLGGLNG